MVVVDGFKANRSAAKQGQKHDLDLIKQTSRNFKHILGQVGNNLLEQMGMRRKEEGA